MTINEIQKLTALFHPRSVALIGASATRGKIGRLFMERFVDAGFRELYPIHPRETEIMGFRAWPSVLDVPGPVDLAIVLTPPRAVAGAVESCLEKGVRGVVITTDSLGFEGPDGRVREAELVRAARERGVRIVGPNCLGIFCPAARLPFPQPSIMECGSVGVVSQSGSFADLLALKATRDGIRFSKMVSTGNEADLGLLDFLEYLGQDPDTGIIVLYIEGVKDGRRFHELVRRISASKPILAWKCGETEAGARAAGSHTGALSGERAVWDGVLRGDGVIRVGSLEETLDCLQVLYFQPFPRGRRMAIVTGPGGPAVGAADACLNAGLSVPTLSPPTQEALKDVVPPFGSSLSNPVDLSMASITMQGLFTEAVRRIDRDDDIDMHLIISSNGGQAFCRSVIDGSRELKKPLAVALINPLDEIVEDIKALTGGGVPVYTDPVRAVRALARAAEYGVRRAARTD